MPPFTGLGSRDSGSLAPKDTFGLSNSQGFNLFLFSIASSNDSMRTEPKLHVKPLGSLDSRQRPDSSSLQKSKRASDLLNL